MGIVALVIVLICYCITAWDELMDGNQAMAGVWASYAASVVFFIAMKMK